MNAGYWVTSFLATPGAGLEIDGGFPFARYMSISAYNSYGPLDGSHLYDAQIQPSVGVNGFQSGVGVGETGSYQVQIEASAPPPSPAPNTLYVGQNNALVFVLYRIYDSDSVTDPTGQVGLPEVSTTFRGQVTGTAGGCVASASPGAAASPANVVDPTAAAVGGVFTSDALSTPAAPEWTILDSTHLPNEDGAYLGAQVVPGPGRIVVVQARMPTFPNTNIGDPPWAPADVRYWSLCDAGQYSLQVTACVADHDAVQLGGVATFVFSAPADRPDNATTANGVNWLAWGSASLDLIIYRQILAAASFAHSIAAVPPGASPSSTMGPYVPSIAYCSTAEFESAGAAGCLSSASSDIDAPIAAGPIKAPKKRSRKATTPAPVCRSVRAVPYRLWPANKRFALVTLSGATDRGEAPLAYRITGVRQDEPVARRGITEPDAKRGPSARSVWLRAERDRRGHGRLYFIALKVTDRRGASCRRTVTVAVPRSRGQRRVKDTGRRYRSFAG